MTVVLITSISRYIGDTADTKPTSCPTGSTYFDRQTGIMYITYDGGAHWVEKPSDDTIAALLGAGLPAALGAGLGLKSEGVGVAGTPAGGVQSVQGVANGTAQPVSAASGAFASGAIANGANVAQGSTTDTPLVGTEDNTARTVVSLLKGIKNTLYVTLLGLLGTTADTPADVVEDNTARTHTSLLKGIKNYLKTIATGVTATVSGTVTANQGTAGATAWPTSDAGFKVATEHKIVNSADATGIIDITDAPTAGQKRVLVDIIVSTDTAMNVTVLEETSGTVKHGPWYLAGPSGVPQATTRSTPMSKLDTADKKYRLDASVAGNITVETWSYSEA